MQEAKRGGVVVVLGTGGTIAGTAASASDNLGYTAGQVGVAQLLAGVPAVAGLPLQAEQIAQIDSKDMDGATWQALATRAAWHLARPEVDGVVVTHGTDTMEETAYLLQRVLAPAKPIVLTGAMRPATAVLQDGPQNLFDAVTVARTPGARGVSVVFAGTVFAADAVRKVHPYRLDAFDAGDEAPIGRVEEGAFRATRPWPHPPVALGAEVLTRKAAADWPRVELVTSHAGADGVTVDMLLALNARGFVVAGTGNGTVHQGLEAALRRAQSAGALVLRTTRCAVGRIVGGDIPADADALPSTPLTPVQARVELLLSLLAAA